MLSEIEKIIEAKPKVFVAACTEWCGPCRRINIQELQELMPGVHVQKIDVEENTDFATKHGIKSVPTILIFRDGELVQSIVGLKSAVEYKKVADTVLG